jgi:hypothetical protein
LPKLEKLKLNSTQITDVGLQRLKEIKQLRELSLTHTKATDAGVLKLHQALPNCEIRR